MAGFEGLKYVINIGIENVLRVYSLIKILECQCINDLCFDVVLLKRMSEAYSIAIAALFCSLQLLKG